MTGALIFGRIISMSVTSEVE